MKKRIERETQVSVAAPLQKKLAATVRDTLLAGGAILRAGFAGRRVVRFKTPTSPVTQIDLRSEKAIVDLVRRRFPDHTFLAEESAHARKGDLGRSRPGRFRWVIDPLDGTVNYLHRIPLSCVSVAVETGGVVLAGGVYDPFRDELFLAERGKGATLNGRTLRVSDEPRLSQALLITGFPYDHRRWARLYLSVLEAFLKKCQDVRRLGSAAIDLAWISAGRADGFWEYKLNPWDVAAGLLLVQEAGGRVSDFSGGPFLLDRTGETLASNGKIHAEMLRVFSGLRRNSVS